MDMSLTNWIYRLLYNEKKNLSKILANSRLACVFTCLYVTVPPVENRGSECNEIYLLKLDY